MQVAISVPHCVFVCLFDCVRACVRARVAHQAWFQTYENSLRTGEGYQADRTRHEPTRRGCHPPTVPFRQSSSTPRSRASESTPRGSAGRPGAAILEHPRSPGARHRRSPSARVGRLADAGGRPGAVAGAWSAGERQPPLPTLPTWAPDGPVAAGPRLRDDSTDSADADGALSEPRLR